MNVVIELLSKLGCDMDGAVKRLGSEEILLAMLPEVLSSSAFEELGVLIHDENVKDAFEKARAIETLAKGMGLSPLYDVACSVARLLRIGIVEGAEKRYEALMRTRNILKEMIDGQYAPTDIPSDFM